MFETLLTELIKNVFVPEIANFMKSRFQQTGKFPTELELREQIDNLANQIKREGSDFLNRPKQVHIDSPNLKNKSENSSD